MNYFLLRHIKVTVLALICCFSSFGAQAQLLDFAWAKQAVNSFPNDIVEDGGTSITVDATGNTYVTGYFSKSVTFGTITLTTSSSGYEIFVVKYGPAGNVLWAKSAGSPGTNDAGTGITVDANGNVYVSGYFTATANFSNISLVSSGESDIFIAKYDSSGNIIWVKKAGGFSFDTITEIEIDSNGNIYATGSFNVSATFGTTTLLTNGGASGFIAKYDGSGNILWIKKLSTGYGNTGGACIAVDSNGNSYVQGYFKGTVSFGSTTFTNTNYIEEIFVAKYDTLGDVVWARQEGPSSGSGSGIAVDNIGNCFFTGKSSGFLVKYDVLGNVLWTKQAGGGSNPLVGQDIALDAAGNCYVTGGVNGTRTFGNFTLTSSGGPRGGTDIFIAKYDGALGNEITIKKSGSPNPETPYSITLDNSGNCFLTGTFISNITFGNTTLTSGGIGSSSEMFVTKINRFNAPSNILLSAANINENVLANSTIGILSTTDANPADTHSYTLVSGAGDTDNANFNISGNNLRINNSPDFEIKNTYSIRIRTTEHGGEFFEKSFNITIADLFEGPLVLGNTAPTSFCQGSSLVLPFTATGNYNSGNIFTAQLSDATGSFSNPVAIGSLPGAQAGSIPVTIPAGQAAGSSYRIRIIASDPVTIGLDKGWDFTVIALPTATISGSTLVCYNSTGNTITFTGAGSAGPYTFTYNINGGPNLTAVTNAAQSSVSVPVPTDTPGIFNYQLISVTAAGGCSQVQAGAATITVNSNIVIAGSQVNVTANGGATGSATVSASGGTAPYIYSWNASPVQTSATVTGLTTVTYQVTVTDAVNCSKTHTINISAPAPTITSISPDNGPSGTIVTITGSNFNPVVANNMVFFGAVKATMAAASTTNLTVIVPAGATYGPVRVLNTATALAASSAQFFNPTFNPPKGVFTNVDLAPRTDFASLPSLASICIEDLDGDGKPDLIAGSNGHAVDITVHRNTSTSANSVSFAPKVDITSYGQKVKTSDIDGDGKSDLVFHGSRILRNTSTNGAISFNNEGVFVNTTDAEIGDMDGDGKPDLVTYSGNSFVIYRNISNKGVIGFAPRADFPAMLTASGNPANAIVTVADIDTDGRPDIVLGHNTLNTISIFLNTSSNGTLSFGSKIDVPTTKVPGSIKIADLDGDGKKDIILAHWYEITMITSGGLISVLRNTGGIGTVSFAANVDFPTLGGINAFTVGDMNGDGKPDLVNGSQDNYAGYTSTVSLFSNTGSAGTISFAPRLDFTSAWRPLDIAIGDLNSDGKPEIVAPSWGGDVVSVFRNLPLSTNANLSNLTLSAGPVSPVFASNTTAYTASVANAFSFVTVTPTVSLPHATVKVNGVLVASGTASGAIALAVGSNTITTVVTAQNGTTTKTYTLTVTRAGAPTAPAITAHPVNKNVCSGGSATFSVTADNATAYQWQVDTGSGFTDVLNSGTYSGATSAVLTITGVTNAMSGYTFRAIATGAVSPAATSNAANLTVSDIAITPSQTNASCNGAANGSASVVVSGGAGSYTYIWAPSGGSGASASGLVAGTYTVTVTDGAGCQKTQSFIITQPAAITIANTSKTDVNCNGDSNGTASVSVSGGAGSYTYDWAPGNPAGDGTANVTGLTAGNWTVTISDANNCNITRTFTISQPGSLVATGSQTNVSTNGGANGSASVIVSGGTGPYAYSWAPSGGASAVAGNLSAGSYTVTITDAKGCLVTRSFAITQPAISTNANLSNLVLSNGTLSPTFASGTTSYAATVTNSIASITVTPTKAEANATIKVNGIVVSSGSASSPISLSVGSNTIITEVTAQDGSTTKAYSVVVTRSPSANANLSSLAISNGTLSPAFTATTTSYSASVNNSVASVTITPAAADANAAIKVNSVAVISGNSSSPISLVVGSNTITTVVTAQNGSTTKTYTLVVNRQAPPNTVPTDIALSGVAVDENVAANTAIGTLSTTDANAGNTHTYTLVTGTGSSDNGSFLIAGNSLNIKFSPNYEIKNSYSIRVRTTDQGGLFYEKLFIITVNNINEAPSVPTDVNSITNNVVENAANGSLVGVTAAATDPDAGTTLAYSLSNNAGGRFAINASNGVVTVANGTLLDFETVTSHTITVQATDGLLTASANFNILLTDADEISPTVLISSTASNPTPLNPIPVSIVFSENVTGFSLADITISSGTKSTFSGSGKNYSFNFIPADSGTTTISVAANMAADAAGNGNIVSNTFSITYNPPTITWTGTVSGNWGTSGNWNPAGVPTAFHNVTIPVGTPNPLVYTTGSVSVRSLIVQAGAVFTMSGGTLNLTSRITNNGTFTQTNGTVVMNGTANQIITGTAPTSFYNFTAGAGGVTLGSPVSIQRVLSLTGNMITNGNLTLLSNAAGTAMLVNNPGEITGTITMQRYINGSKNIGLGYRHFSSPVQHTTVQDFQTSGFTPVVNPAFNTSTNPGAVLPYPTVLSYDQTRITNTNNTTASFDFGWQSLNSLSQALVPGVGYSVNVASTENIDLQGVPNNETITINNLNVGGTVNAGWHLLGNPYPSPIDLNALVIPAGMYPSFYVYRSTGKFTGNWVGYVNGVGAPTGIIPAMQGFMVKCSTNVASFSFTNSARVTTYQNPAFYKVQAETRPLLNLEIKNNAQEADETYIYLENGATSAFEGDKDSYKIDPASQIVGIYTLAGIETLSVNGLGTAFNQQVPLAVGGAAGNLTIAVSQLINFADYDVVLEDKTSNIFTTLTPTTVYSFNHAGGNVSNRFVIHLNAKVNSTAESASGLNVNVFPNPNNGECTVQLIGFKAEKAIMTVSDVLGREVMTKEVKLNSTAFAEKLSLPKAKGVYLLQVKTNAQIINKKIVAE